jgi:hypothetical protein
MGRQVCIPANCLYQPEPLNPIQKLKSWFDEAEIPLSSAHTRRRDVSKDAESSCTDAQRCEDDSTDARMLGRMPNVAQSALYRDRICCISFTMSASAAEVSFGGELDGDGFTRGNWDISSKRCLM